MCFELLFLYQMKAYFKILSIFVFIHTDKTENEIFTFQFAAIIAVLSFTHEILLISLTSFFYKTPMLYHQFIYSFFYSRIFIYSWIYNLLKYNQCLRLQKFLVKNIFPWKIYYNWMIEGHICHEIYYYCIENVYIHYKMIQLKS